MMDQAIRDFAKQFEYDPVIENAAALKSLQWKRVVVCGMGGSHLAADLMKIWQLDFPLSIHSDYDLPHIPPAELQETLIVASSYSGNTEETLSAFSAAHAAGLPLVAIAVGGALIDEAKKLGVPYIQLPDTGIQPRLALGFSIRALARVLGQSELFEELSSLANSLKPEALEGAGKELAVALKGKIPVIYASASNCALAYNWKIKFNETGKIPAFYNVLPELNHNEMTGFDRQGGTAALSEQFSFIFLADSADHSRVAKRMQILAKLYADRGLPVTTMTLTGQTTGEKIFNSLLTADWAAFHAASQYGVEAEQVPMVEEFKKHIA